MGSYQGYRIINNHDLKAQEQRKGMLSLNPFAQFPDPSWPEELVRCEEGGLWNVVSLTNPQSSLSQRPVVLYSSGRPLQNLDAQTF